MIESTLVRLKNLATINEDQLGENTDPDYVFEYVDVGSVGRGYLVDQPDKVRFADAPTRARRLVRSGDTIVSTVRTYLRAILPMGLELSDVVVSTGFAVVRPRPMIDPRFLAWAVQADSFVEEVVARSTGVSYPAIAPSAMSSIALAVPTNPSHQTLIADFLDRETHRIDALVDAKRRMIDLLREKRIAEIQRGMTTGPSNELVPFKERPLRSAAFVQIGRQRAPRHAEGPFMTRYLRAANVKDRRLDLDDVLEMNFTPAEQKVFALRAGDVLVTEGAGSLEAVGASAVWNGELGGVVCYQNTLIRLRPRPGVSFDYLGWWSTWAYTLGHFASVASGANIFHLSSEKVRTLPIKTPPIEVQEVVVRRLEFRVSAIAAAIEAIGRQLALLAEYRQALITQAVMGDLDEATLNGDRPVDEVVGVIPE